MYQTGLLLEKKPQSLILDDSGDLDLQGKVKKVNMAGVQSPLYATSTRA